MRPITLLINSLLAISLAGCGGDTRVSITDDGISVPLPEQLRQIRAVDKTQLILQVTVNDGTPIRVANQSTDRWAAQIPVPKDQSSNIKLEWSANVNNTPVLLADFETTIAVEQQDLTVDVYQTAGARFDEDSDGITNLVELRENRNPLDRIDLTIPRSNATFLSPSLGVQSITDDEVSGDSFPAETANSEFAIWHDDQFLRFLFCVQDNSVHNDGGDPNSGTFEYWHDDAVEIYIDAGNNATPGSQFDTTDDFQFVYTPDPESTGQYTNDLRLSNNSGARPICPDGQCSSHRFRTSANCGYELSVELDLAQLGLTSGSEFGLDVEILDDDNGGLRDAKYAWKGSENNSFIFPYTFGKVRLE